MPTTAEHLGTVAPGWRGALRSRGGCWTCRSRHKKCDEEKPDCRACRKSGRACAGYEPRLNWVGDRRRPRRDEGALALREETCSPSPEVDPEPGSPPADSRIEHVLLEKFRTSGQYTLAGRASQGSRSIDDVLALCTEWAGLWYVVLAYQARLDETKVQLSAVFLSRALNLYQSYLAEAGRRLHDATLMTGILLCSVGISSLLPWTMHLDGLEAILVERGCLDPFNRSPNIAHLVEVVGLLDLPTITIGRVRSKRFLWTRFVAPGLAPGVEYTSGLPRSLLNIMAQLGARDVEHSLVTWPGERGEDYMCHHLWEAARVSAILHNRALTAPRNEYTDTPVLVMRILASVEAIWTCGRNPFKQPLRKCVLYPLFTGGLYSETGSPDRDFVRRCFEELAKDTASTGGMLAWNLLQETWIRRKEHIYESLEIADRCARELQIEVHLY